MSSPRINPDDPKWTAYVLGELDPAERAEIERLLDTSVDARALVEELQVATMALKDEVTSAAPLAMTPDQRTAVHRAAESRPSRPLAAFPRRWAWGLSAVAAGLFAVAAVVPTFLRVRLAQPTARIDVPVAPPAPNAGFPAAPESQRAFGPPDNGQERRAIAPPETAVAVTPPVEPSAQPSVPAPVNAAPILTIEQFARLNAGMGGATLTGAVRDSSGAALPGVTVTAVNPDTGVASTAITDGFGLYTFANLQPGQAYRLTASLTGFQTATYTNLQIDPAGSIRRDFTMAVGAVAKAVTVSGETPVVDLQSTTTERVMAVAPPPPPSASAVGGVAAGVVGGLGGAGREPLATFSRGGAAVASASPVAGTRFDPPDVSRIPAPRLNTEAYDRILDNPFIRASQEPLATFSIDVDTASYANVRRFLNQNQLPPKDAVRIEELINYFSYNYAQPSGRSPVAPNMEVAAAPWNPQHRLVRIGIKAHEIDATRRPASNLVFLVDVSGSMNTPQKLPLVKAGLKMLVDQLGENDVVSMVVYASATGLVLPPTSGQQKAVIQHAIDNLQAGGSTNGGAGIQLAYRQATTNFIRGGVNRVILMTDGDFNVGITNQGDLTRLIEERAKSGVFLSVLGFGMGNLKDSTMEKLADMGNGHYAYIDTLNEARKVLVEEMGGTLVTVAKDVKIQVDFNPGRVEAYRLIGYENRVLRAEDFNNDLKDAGDMGAGHTVTALFEVVPRGGAVPGPSVDPSVFQPRPAETPRPTSTSSDMLVLRVRYKLPEASDSTRMDVPLTDRGAAFAAASPDFRFAAAVAAFGMILRESPYSGTATLSWVIETAAGSRGQDRSGYRSEFIALVQKASALRTAR